MSAVLSLPTLENLREHVRMILCSRDRMDPHQTPVAESLITRSGRCCGIFFQTRGPRGLVSRAIWAANEGRVLFYDSRGVRFGETQLIQSPDLACSADN